MEKPTTIILAHNIVSPLGTTSHDNYAAVAAGRSGLRLYEKPWDQLEPAMLSLIDRNLTAPDGSGRTFFEQIAILSASEALSQTDIDAASPRTAFILSSTKGNRAPFVPDYSLPDSATAIAAHFGNHGTALCVSNACTSGVSALIVAKRLLESRLYDNAVVIGADVQSAFTVSGFQSFKALSAEPCRPFDRDRQGLNLGEAAATIVLGTLDSHSPNASGLFRQSQKKPSTKGTYWQITGGAMGNDANHISGPSRTGEGAFRALQGALGDFDREQLAYVCAHGTATPYNDEMEAIALHRAGLDAIPTSSLKPHFGHTMGAAGIVETIITMLAISDHCLLPTLGYANCGTSHNINILKSKETTNKRAFVKMLSGFGGCNAAILCEMKNEETSSGCFDSEAENEE